MIDKNYLKKFAISFIFTSATERGSCSARKKDLHGKILSLIQSEMMSLNRKYPHWRFKSEYEVYLDIKNMSILIFVDYYNATQDMAAMKKITWKLT